VGILAGVQGVLPEELPEKGWKHAGSPAASVWSRFPERSMVDPIAMVIILLILPDVAKKGDA
jgi:hypothetical protein